MGVNAIGGRGAVGPRRPRPGRPGPPGADCRGGSVDVGDGEDAVDAALWFDEEVLGRGGAAEGDEELVAGAYLATYTTTADDGGIGWLALLWSALIASFIWVGATQAIRAERVRDRIPLLSARGLARRAALVSADTPLAEAIRRAHADHAGAIVIADHDGRPLGLVNEKAVTATPEHRRPWITAGELSRGVHDDLTLPADITGDDLLDALRRAPASEYLLVEPDGRVYGVLAVSDVDRTFTGN
jgi:hypothetical protein